MKNIKKENDGFLIGDKIILRPLAKEDLPYLINMGNNLEIRKLFDENLFPYSVQEAINHFEKREKKDDYVDLAIVAKKDGTLIGNINIRDISWKDRTAITGTTIYEKKYWGKGYGTEARMLLLNYAFNYLNLRKIKVFNFEFNKRSWDLSLRLGFVEEGRKRKEIFVDGQYWDEILLGLFKEDWLPIWEKYKKDNKI